MKKCCSSLRDFFPAFSLVEMLMALLVASLLLAALAPVMTRRMADHEIKVMSEAANYDKDMVISVFTEDTDFNIPSDANQVRVTMMGGGGRGGDALYGNKEFTSTQNFTVPQNVTKLRVFMIGGGGGGASGGGSGTAYGNIEGTAGSQEYAGSSSANTGVKTWTIPGSAKGNTAALDERCKLSSINRWTLVSDTTRTAAAGDTVVTIKACGGGGGGSGGNNEAPGGGGGSSGGYINKDVVLPSNINSVSVTIGGGGGGGGNNDSTNNHGFPGQGWGGGGGGTEGYSTARYSATGISPGGNGAFTVSNCKTSTTNDYTNAGNGIGTVGAGAGVGGQSNGGVYICARNAGSGSLEGGGGGGGSTAYVGGGGGGGATFFGRYAYSTTDDKDFFLVAPGGGGGGEYWTTGPGSHANTYTGGGGGGGYGGGNGGGYNNPGASAPTGGNSGSGSTSSTLGGAGGASPIGNANYCAGGKGGDILKAGANGKNGYMLISWAPKTNALKCDYDITANGGGGGGAGQITIGEINVTAGETLTFEIGNGGAKQTTIASNGNNGTATHIKRGSSSIISANGGYGGEFSSSESTKSQGGLARNPNILNNWTGINYRNNITNAAGNDGYLANDILSAGHGGKGGSSQNIKGEILNGGDGGNSIKNGNTPLSTSYGAGGGGGAGGLSKDDDYGTGGAGASGYIYVEWGGSNGGGGTAGEFIQKTYTNIDNNNRVMKIRIGRGGGITTGSESSPITDSTTIGLNGNGGITSTKAYSGGKEITYSANGGIKGKDGDVNKGNHGGETGIPSGFSDKYKEYIQGNMNIILGQKADDEYGGMGGYLSCLYKSKDEEGNEVCAATVKANDGSDNSTGPIRPGCGGTSIASPLYDAVCRAYSSNDSPNGGNGTFGAGGGGGAVLDNVGGKGGNGGNGFVILEYKSTTLD